MKLIDWLKASFPVQQIKKNEVNFNCPKCSHSSFYFNLNKKIGYCHRASCNFKPSLRDLIDLKGYGPSSYYLEIKPEPIVDKEIILPGWSALDDKWVIEALKYRGVDHKAIGKWQIRASHFNIYIPVIENSKIVQLVGRAVDRNKIPKEGFNTSIKPKYKYTEGKSISNFILGWDECKEWEYIILVENSFNAIAWREKFNCSTNFGSNLSEAQIKLIHKSKIKSIVLAWDADAINKAWAAAIKLNKIGIKTSIIKYQKYNQPDEVPFDILEKTIKQLQNTTNAPITYGPLIMQV